MSSVYQMRETDRVDPEGAQNDDHFGATRPGSLWG